MPNTAATLPVRAARNKPKLLDHVRDVIRRKQFSIFRMSRRRPPAKTSDEYTRPKRGHRRVDSASEQLRHIIRRIVQSPISKEGVRINS